MNDDSNCPVCLSKPNIPIVLSCNHVFCYLCLKGSSTSHMNCPICRQPFPSSVFTKPNLREKSIKLPAKSAKWSYQGRRGYWLFDKITNRYMENAYQHKKPNCEVVIAGNAYIIDFTTMMQYRKDIPGKRRHIKRSINLDKREIIGVAGVSQKILKVKMTKPRPNSNSGEGTSSSNQPDDTLDSPLIRSDIDDREELDNLQLPVATADHLLTKIKTELIDKPDEPGVTAKEVRHNKLMTVKQEIIDESYQEFRVKQEPNEEDINEVVIKKEPNFYDEDTQ